MNKMNHTYQETFAMSEDFIKKLIPETWVLDSY
jgi:hypothetical protein